MRYVIENGERVGETHTREPEWDEIDTEMMLALDEVEADICPGCGGFLSEELIQDHGYHVETKLCTRCEVIGIFNDKQAVIDKRYDGEAIPNELGGRPSARRMFVTRIDLPQDQQQE